MAERGIPPGLRRLIVVGFLCSIGAAPEAGADRPWAFRPVVRRDVPRTADGPANPIDAFLGKSMRRDGIRPAPEADRRTLVRRLSFDFLGLPPTPDQVDEFVADGRPDAYERLVDRLLADPRYGERWGRHWLDLVRFAETHGYERDDPKPGAWRYRDWVIAALNADLPYDRFIVAQLAGDELPDATAASKTATGMYRLGLIDDEPADPVTDRFDQLDDMIKTVGTTFLGLSIHCARCHDHKFDPITQKDYYKVVAFLAPSKPFVRDDNSSISVPVAEESQQARVAELKGAVARQLADLRMRLPKDEGPLKDDVERRIAALLLNPPNAAPEVLGLTDVAGTPPVTRMLPRGDAHKPGAEVAPGFLSAVDNTPPAIAATPNGTTGRRLALARWIARRDNPLTARVMVNRLWQHHFGRGLVGTPSDFGAMGEEPVQPELLDWLADELAARGWSLKAMHRLMVTSAAYRRAETSDPALIAEDPENIHFARRPPHRLEAEPIRDAVLAVSGALNSEAGGPGVRPAIAAAVLAGQSRPGSGWVVTAGDQADRRSVYVYVKRTLPLPELEVLDAADNNDPCPRRAETTTAPQALTLLNSAFYHEQAARFARRLDRESGGSIEARVRHAFRLAFGREPSDDERRASLAFLAQQADRIARRPRAEDRKEPAAQALESFCLALLNANEFVTVD